MEGALFKKVTTTALFCRPNKRSPDEPSETEVNADISSFQWRPFNFFSGDDFCRNCRKTTVNITGGHFKRRHKRSPHRSRDVPLSLHCQYRQCSLHIPLPANCMFGMMHTIQVNKNGLTLECCIWFCSIP
jgi:hypothetical protein